MLFFVVFVFVFAMSLSLSLFVILSKILINCGLLVGCHRKEGGGHFKFIECRAEAAAVLASTYFLPQYHHKETSLGLWITNPVFQISCKQACVCEWKQYPFEKICIPFSRFVPTIANWPSEQIDKLLWICQLDLNTFERGKNTLKVNWASHKQMGEKKYIKS